MHGLGGSQQHGNGLDVGRVGHQPNWSPRRVGLFERPRPHAAEKHDEVGVAILCDQRSLGCIETCGFDRWAAVDSVTKYRAINWSLGATVDLLVWETVTL